MSNGPQKKNNIRRRELTSKRAPDALLDALYAYDGEVKKGIINESVEKSIGEDSRRRPEEHQETFSNGGALQGEITPPYNMYALAKLPFNNNVLGQCIDVMVTNIESYGFRLEYIGPEGEEKSEEALNEKNELRAFLDYPNGDYSLTELRMRLRQDYETFGNSYMEVTRDKTGKIRSLYHLPAHTMRVVTHDREYTESFSRVRDDDGNYRDKPYRRRFRRYIQKIGGVRTYFKEFGDPRNISVLDGSATNQNLPFAETASEVVHFSRYNPGSPYGLPRWFNQIPSIMGSREAELTNLDYFSENAIPAMVVMVAGGHLTEESMDAIEQTFTNIRGRAAQNRVAVIEAAGDIEAASEDGKVPTPKISLESLSSERQGDALFQEYDHKCREKIRSSFRLPPIFIGESREYNRATSEQSMIMAESQIFAPERRKIDEFFNTKILTQFEPRFWRFKSMPPRVAGTDDLIATIKGLSSVGAITPNAAVNLVEELLDIPVNYIKEKWGDVPFFITQAQAQNGFFGDIGVGRNRHGTPAPATDDTSTDDESTEDEVEKHNELLPVTKLEEVDG